MQTAAHLGGTLRALMSLVTERMRRLESSDSKIMPSMLLYSSSDTYAPISAMLLTCATRVHASATRRKAMAESAAADGDPGCTLPQSPSLLTQRLATCLNHDHVVYFWVALLIHTAVTGSHGGPSGGDWHSALSRSCKRGFCLALDCCYCGLPARV